MWAFHFDYISTRVIKSFTHLIGPVWTKGEETARLACRRNLSHLRNNLARKFSRSHDNDVLLTDTSCFSEDIRPQGNVGKSRSIKVQASQSLFYYTQRWFRTCAPDGLQVPVIVSALTSCQALLAIPLSAASPMCTLSPPSSPLSPAALTTRHIPWRNNTCAHLCRVVHARAHDVNLAAKIWLFVRITGPNSQLIPDTIIQF